MRVCVLYVYVAGSRLQVVFAAPIAQRQAVRHSSFFLDKLLGSVFTKQQHIRTDDEAKARAKELVHELFDGK